MLTKIGLRKSSGLCLAVVAVVGLTLVPVALPERVAAQERPATQAGAHPVNPGLSRPAPELRNQFTNPPSWFGRQTFPNIQSCSGWPNAFSYAAVSGSPFADQFSTFGWSNAAMQSSPGGPDAMFWFGYGSGQMLWWSYPNFNQQPGLGFCGGFQPLIP